MSIRNVTASFEFETVERIKLFQNERGIKYFADAVEAYIIHLEGRSSANPLVSIGSTIFSTSSVSSNKSNC